MVDVRLRSAGPLDDDFLAALYRSSRADEIAAAGWTGAVADAFVAQQRAAQERAYRADFPGSEQHIVVLAGHPVGRLWVDRTIHRVLIVDVSLLPDARGRGLGSRLIVDVIAGADASAVGVELSVRHDNVRAAVLYRRLGFSERSRTDTHLRMHRPWSNA